MHIHADVTGKAISIPEEQQATVLGCAILATVGAGIYNSIEEAASQMVRIKKVVEPDLSKHDEYRFYVAQYIETYESLKGGSRRMVQHLQQNQK